MTTSSAGRSSNAVDAWAALEPGFADGVEAATDPGSFQVTVRFADLCDVVVLVGEFDLATAPLLTLTIDRLLLLGRHRIVIDLDAVTFVDAVAVEALITSTLVVALAGGRLHLTYHRRLMSLLEFTRETHRVNVAEAVEDAGLSAVRGRDVHDSARAGGRRPRRRDRGRGADELG